MLSPAGRFYVPKSSDHSDHGKLLAGSAQLVRAWRWDAGDGATRHVMVGFSDPTVRSLPSERDEAAQRLGGGQAVTISPRLAPDAGERVGRAMVRKAWMKREQWFVWIAAAFVVTMVLAAAIGGYMGRWWDFL
jgi:hypothetical protein